jgi:putative DNA primase/helicase
MIEAISPVNPLVAENIPPEFTDRPQWVSWRLEERDGKMTKIPYTPATARRASTTDLMTWGTFEEALGAYNRTHALYTPVVPYSGIGYVFSSGDPFVGIDLDNCRNPQTREISAWAQKLIDRVQEGYIEVSPSGTGIHVIVEGTVRGGRSRKKVRVEGEVVGEVEMYGRERFFTVTGELV